jgi:predicted permease
MGKLLQDVRYGLRMLAKSPGFTAVAVVTLALGIGANTAIFSLIDAVMLRSLPIKDPGSVVLMQWAARRNFVNGEYSSFGDCGETGYIGKSDCSFPLPIFHAIRAQTNAFSGVMACAGPAGLDIGGTGPTGTVPGEIVSGDYFSTLGVSAFIGRTLGAADDLASAPPVTVISYAFWQSAFGGSGSVLGRTILLNKVPFTIVGVAQQSGGAVGILFAFWGLHAITSLVTGRSSSHFPYVVTPDWRVLAFALGICVLTGLVFGLAPAFRGTRVDLTQALKESASSVPGSASAPGRFRLGNVLVIAQVALSVVVLIGAGLLVRTLENLRSINPGFDVHNLLLFETDPGKLGYKDAQTQTLFSEMRNRLAAIPGVDSVAYSSVALLMGDEWSMTVHVEGQAPGTEAHVELVGAGPGFLHTMRIPLLEGRSFTPEDFEQAAQIAQAAKSIAANAAASAPHPPGAPAEAANAPPPRLNVLVNQTLARTYFPHENPLGKGIREGGSSGTNGGAWNTNSSKVWQIIGVATDTKYDNLRHTIKPLVYLPFAGGYGGYFELRTATDPHALISVVRSVAKKMDPNLEVSRVTTQTEQIDSLTSQERRVAQLSGFFALLALVLACIGLYGLLSYEVTRRTREIGIRMALGAQRQDVLRMVVRQGLVPACGGIVAGVAVALGVTRYLQSMLYGVHANDPATMIAVAILLLAIAVASCYLPARRATNVDPIVALRYE